MSLPHRSAVSDSYDTIAIRSSGRSTSSHSGNRLATSVDFPSCCAIKTARLSWLPPRSVQLDTNPLEVNTADLSSIPVSVDGIPETS